MKKTFTIGSLMRESWQDYKSNWKQFILIGIIFLLVGFLGNMGTAINPVTGMISQSPFAGILSWALQSFITLGFITFVLNIIDKKEAKIEQLFQGAKSISHYVSFLVISLLVSAITGIIALPFALSFAFGLFSPVAAWIIGTISGVVLLTIVVGLLFARYLVAEQKADIFDSLKQSWKGTRKSQWMILWFIVITLFFNLFGALVFIVGLAITIPMTAIMYARLYRNLFDCACKDGDCVCTPDEEIVEIEVEEVLEGDQSKE